MKLFNLSDKAGRRKFKSELRRRTENSFEIYQSDSGNLYIKDIEERLTFERAKVGDDKYDLSVIIEEDNQDYRPIEWSMPETPCGFLVYEDISLKEFSRLARDYLKHKLKGEDIPFHSFKKWLNEKFYKPTHEALAQNNYYIESMPYPNASKKEWKEFDIAMAAEGRRQQKYEHKAI
jgi:hypothetical protein